MNPLILSVDTTHEYGSLALLHGEKLLEETLLHAPGGFGHLIYDHLHKLLEGQGVKVDAIDCFAAASGPGSFTGVRVGLACIKGLAEACGKPAVAVSNLEALAFYGTQPFRAAVMDARRGEVYGAVYNSQLELVSEETVARFPDWLETLPQEELEFISAEPLHTALEGTRFARSPVVMAPRALAGAVARIAYARFLADQVSDPVELDANYVRRSDAELFWKE